MERLRRSMLFLPGSNRKMIEKAATSEADSVIIDLEDAVAPSQKATARELVVKALQEINFGERERTVRINPLQTAYGREDLLAVMAARPDALVVPKASGPADVLEVDERMGQAEREAGIPGGSTPLILLIETPAAVVRAVEIATCTPRLSALIFGAADYTLEVHGRLTSDRRHLLYPLTQILLAARVAGIDAIDSPHFDLDDEEGLARETELVARLGYDGKAAIHPKQLPSIHGLFTPTPEEVAYARRVIGALEEAQREGRGLISLDGKLIENPHLLMAQRTLRIAEKAGGKG